MAARRTSATGTRAKTAAAKRTPAGAAPRSKKKATATAAKTVAAKPARPTLASIAAQITSLAEQIEALTLLVRRPPSGDAGDAGDAAPASLQGADETAEVERFPTTLVETVADLDRRGRHTGMVPIPDLRRAFVARGCREARSSA